MFFLFFRDSSIRFRSAEGWITHTQRSIKFLLTRFYVKIVVSSLPFTHHELMPNSQFGARVFIMTLTRWASQKVKRAAARRRLAIRRSRDTKDSMPDAKPAGPPPKSQPFRIDLARNHVWTRGPLGTALERSLEKMLHFPEMQDIYRRVHEMHDDRHFVDKVLAAMKVAVKLSQEDLARIPTTGPAVVVANHPFGAIEGLVLASVLRRVRPDVKVMANFLLSRLPELDDVMLYVDPFGKKESVTRNLRSMRAAVEWVKKGGLLAVFPAGAVAHLHLDQRAIVDPPWSASIGRIIRRTAAPVVPIFFGGSNGPMFQLAGLVHPMLRTAMIPRELLNKQHRTLPMVVGNPIAPHRLQSFDEDQPLVDYLRVRTYILGNRLSGTNRSGTQATGVIGTASRAIEPIIAPVDVHTLAWEIKHLPADTLYLDAGTQSVYITDSQQAPHVLREIGRLREVTFRKAGEGTGQAIDLDQYDPHYLHLFIWNKPTHEIVGAYRLGMTDVILKNHGLQGLYTCDLFGYPRQLLDQIGPTLELGRAFVRPEYQRSYSPLMLLWKGIGHFIARHPRYRHLLGPVSINNEYHSVSRELIIAFLKSNRLDPELSKLIKPKNPPKLRGLRGATPTLSLVVRDIEDVSAIVSEIEQDHKGVPILLKQYLKLNARILGFNVDPAFGDVTDGLILLDLMQTDPRILQKYLGFAGFSQLQQTHR